MTEREKMYQNRPYFDDDELKRQYYKCQKLLYKFNKCKQTQKKQRRRSIKMEFTKKQIADYMDKYIKNYLVDAEWQISLATDFLHLLNDEKIELSKLSDQRYVKSVLENNPDSEYTKKVNMRSTPEVYISALVNRKNQVNIY